MNNNDLYIDPDDLIARYLAGESKPSETKMLEDWVKESAQNRAYFQEARNAWIVAGTLHHAKSINTGAGWEKLSKSIHGGNVVRKKEIFHLRPALRYAAAVIAVLALGTLLYLYLSKPSMKEFRAGNEPLTELLPDNSEVTLNANSVLTYQSSFKGRSREVKLTGDGFFKITRDPSKPFIIRAGETQVRVLGTSFYVNAREEEKQVKVTVSTGLVTVIGNKQEIRLNPGETGLFDKTDKTLVKKQNSDPNYISWKTKVLVFNGERLENVFRKIEQVYRVKIRVMNPGINDCRLTATFEKLSPDQVMEVIRATFGLEVKIRGKDIEVVGNGCGE